MKNISLFYLFLVVMLIVSTSFNLVEICLCNKDEKNIISFKILKSTKSVSICEGKNAKYLVYRFGKKDKIELEFPNKKDESSWNEFSYDAYYRGGGFQNAAMTMFNLSFINKDVNYKVYQYESAIDSNDNFQTVLGIEIENGNKFTSLEGDTSTLLGSLGTINKKINK